MKQFIGIVVIAMAIVPAGASLVAPAGALAASPKTYTIAIRGYTFVPRHLVVNAGDRVVWLNKDADQHTVSGNGKASSVLHSRALGHAGRYSVTMARAGMLRYHCAFHAFMSGIVQVRAHPGA